VFETQLIHMRDTTDSCVVRHDSFMRETWPICTVTKGQGQQRAYYSVKTCVLQCCSVAVHCSAWQGVANRHINMRANAQFDPSQALLALRARDSLGVLKKTAFDIAALRVTVAGKLCQKLAVESCDILNGVVSRLVRLSTCWSGRAAVQDVGVVVRDVSVMNTRRCRSPSGVSHSHCG